MSATLAVEEGLPGAGGAVVGEPVFESRGIDYIPLAERSSRPRDLAWLWFGALCNIEFVTYGAILIVGFGLRFWQAAVVILVANTSYIVTGLGSLQGPKAGTAAFTINRAPFGPNGARIVAFFNWITQVGYEVLGLAIVVAAGLALCEHAGVHSSTALKIGLIVAAAGVQLLLPLLGHGTMLRVMRTFVIPFVILFVVLAVMTVGKAHLGAGHNASWAQMMEGLAFVLAAGGYSWPMNANDFSRYLPKATRARPIVLAVALGGFIPTTLLLLLGAAVATRFPGASGATTITQAFAGWFIWPFLIFAIVQVFAINSLDLYTSGLTLQTIVPKVKRWQCVLIDTVLAGCLTAWTVFDSSFDTFVSDFVLFMLIWLAPWVMIYLVDYFLRRGSYSSAGLQQTRQGIYFRNGGFHIPGIVAQGVGMLAAASWLNAAPAWISPLSSRTGGADFSVFMGAIVGGGLYYLLAHRRVAAEGEAAKLEPSLDAILTS